ncbi:MAG: cell division protein FtsL [Deltaproteobacteria bacterium RBG_13_47_9]|nr:MAG: cell division protein FtsL [Deltaproteobacteria bacterium RBG_13_47_9]
MAKTMSRGSDRILWTGEGTKAKPMTTLSNQLFLIALSILLFIVGSLFYVWSRIQVIESGYDISKALKEGKGLTEVNKKLKLEIATLKSYARIEKIAVEDLRMSKPKPDQVIVIR